MTALRSWLRRHLGIARRRVVTSVDAAAGKAVADALARFKSSEHCLDELVHPLITVADRGRRRFVLSTSGAGEDSILVADLREPGSLPAAAFDRIVLARPFAGRAADAAIGNVCGALRISGEVIAVVPRRMQRKLEARGLIILDSRRVQLWRVARCMRGR